MSAATSPGMQRRPRSKIGIASLVAVQLVTGRAWAEAPGDTTDAGASDRADAESIGIEDLIGAAVTRSPELIRIKSERKIAREIAKAAAAPDQWRVGASVDWSRGTASRIDGQPVQQVGQENLTTTVAVDKRLPTGGQLAVTLSESRLFQKFAVSTQQAAAGDEGIPDDVYVEAIGHVATARVGVVQPLLRGRGSTVSQADRHRTETSAKRTAVKARYDAGLLVHDLVVLYWEVAYAAAEIDVRRDSVKAAREQLAAAKDLFKACVLAVSGLKAAEYAVGVREEALLRATLNLEEVSLVARQRAGLEVGPHDIALSPTDPLELDDTDWSVDDALASAKEHNPRIEGAELGVALAAIDVAVGDDAVTPAVDFRASAAAIGGGEDVGGAFSGLGSAEAYEITAGVAVQYELGGAARALSRAAHENHAAATTDVEIVKRDVIVSVVRAVHRVRAARKRADVAAKAIELATATLKAEQVAFRAGRQTSYIVLERQAEVDEARLLQARAVADYHQAVAAVQLESGELLGRWGVEVRGKDRRRSYTEDN
jgi:outer membrane protein TolC